MKTSLFARAVSARMRERGLGLREFCRSVRVDPSFFSKVLSGKRSPPWDEGALRRIAALLRLDAPLLIVSAGRVPAEWERIASDPALFDAVNRLAAGPGKRPEKQAGSESSWSRVRAERSIRRSRQPSPAFGEELL